MAPARAKAFAPKKTANEIATRIQGTQDEMHDLPVFAFIIQSMAAAAMVFERVVNLDRIIPHKTVGTRCETMRTTKNSLYVMHICAENSKRSDSPRIKIVWVFLNDVRRRHN